MMIAVVILGIGLLITASMFPIAWYKARDVAEASFVPTAVDSAEIVIKTLCRPSTLNRAPRIRETSFFGGDWIDTLAGVGPEPWRATAFADTRVHAVNLGNFLAGDPAGNAAYPYAGLVEPDWLLNTATAPVADNGWLLDSSLFARLEDRMGYVAPSGYDGIVQLGLHHAVVAPHARVLPALEGRPDRVAQPELYRQWTEQFDGRRYCWGALYRFDALRGPRGGTQAWANCRFGAGLSTDCDLAMAEYAENPVKQRRMTMYYVTLKRPSGARYARQLGFQPGSSEWAAPPSSPRAMESMFDVLLPVPWRVQAVLVRPTTATVDRCDQPTGIPSQLEFQDPVLAGILTVGVSMVDDRTGQVFRIVQRKTTSVAGRYSLTLNGEYTMPDLFGEYARRGASCDPSRPLASEVPTPANGLVTTPTEAQLQANWQNEWWCSTSNANCVPATDDETLIRYYWVYPPPVEAGPRPNGIPTFAGSPPTVAIESRQVILN